MLAEQLRLAREKSDRVVARRHRRRAEAVDAAEAGTQAIEPAERGGHADRAASVAAEREVAEFRGDGRRRSARRAAGDVALRFDIDRRAVVNVGAEHAVEEFVADIDTGERCAGIEQPLDGAGGGRRALGFGVPGGIAVGDFPAGDGEQILDHEGAAGEGPGVAAEQRLLQRVGHQGADGVFKRH